MGSSWSEKDAVHLLNRAAFHAGPKEVAACLSLGRKEAVRRLISGESLTGAPDPVLPIEQVTADGKPLEPDKIGGQQTYWLYRMAATEAPLVEKMALFWHGHFATSYQKVQNAAIMAGQINMFRRMGLGSFKELLKAVNRDPAMIIWLDGSSNKKGAPNENYAREVMELFTLGLGAYTEADVKEAARAFTGWQADKATGAVRFEPKLHDNGVKTLLSRSGNLDGDQVADVLFEQKALPLFIADKLLRFFAVNEPPEDWKKELAEAVSTSATIGEVLSRLFQSERFYADEVRGALLRTPAEYVAGTVRALQLPLSGGFTSAMRRMGQELYLPPDVAGWRGGSSWIGAAPFLARCQFAEDASRRLKGAFLTSPELTPASSNPSPADWVDPFRRKLGLPELGNTTKQALTDYVKDTVWQAKDKQPGLRGLLLLMLSSPEAQMK